MGGVIVAMNAMNAMFAMLCHWLKMQMTNYAKCAQFVIFLAFLALFNVIAYVVGIFLSLNGAMLLVSLYYTGLIPCSYENIIVTHLWLQFLYTALKTVVNALDNIVFANDARKCTEKRRKRLGFGNSNKSQLLLLFVLLICVVSVDALSFDINEWADFQREHLNFSAPILGALVLQLFHRKPPENFPASIEYEVREDCHQLSKDTWYVQGLTLKIRGWSALTRYLGRSTAGANSDESYTLQCFQDASFVLLPGPYMHACDCGKKTLLQDSSTVFELFIPGMKKWWGLKELGRMRKISITPLFNSYIMSLQGFYVNGVRKSTVKSTDSVLDVVGGRNSTVQDVCRGLKNAFLTSGGEPQSIRYPIGVGTYLIEYKKAATTNDEDEDDDVGVLSWYALLNTLNQYDMDENDDEN